MSSCVSENVQRYVLLQLVDREPDASHVLRPQTRSLVELRRQSQQQRERTDGCRRRRGKAA